MPPVKHVHRGFAGRRSPPHRTTARRSRITCDHAEGDAQGVMMRPRRLRKLVSSGVADLCAGKKLPFQSAGEAPMKGFDEPLALFEVGG